jgi:hypothetical protein
MGDGDTYSYGTDDYGEDISMRPVNIFYFFISMMILLLTIGYFDLKHDIEAHINHPVYHGSIVKQLEEIKELIREK